MARRPRYAPPPRSNPPRSSSGASGGFNLNYGQIALFGGIFVLGVGVGLGFSSSANFSPENVVSREVIDRSAPNPELCVQFGASAIVSDLRVFITLNPFNVFVTQPVMQPGCVLRRNNWSILEQQKLISNEQVRDCKNRMNTFGFTGALEGSPRIDCIYQNNGAGNLFLNQPGAVTPPSETQKF
ncbi:conserved hypothetical protein [Gloeothece citriformis PCC 7424]|uniref:DUF3172 domain-containing protein n=1 Tax=Gloeothece citriformis (strain PCC 7424) TaxID=65393 RepID=B7KHQ5_GLOC7|nr:DUF3172 domain-containing protein [Gloeothece citriformis]ACK70750.1 conserved hypothetical protein [Gloeothece citriformis PCC 7424]